MFNQLVVDSIHFYAGSSAAQRPIAFTLGDEKFNVDKVIAEWRSPEGKFFLVQTPNGQVFTLHTIPDA